LARLTGLFQRGSAFYIKVVLPKDHPLASRYSNGRFVQSLGTCSLREAVQLGTLKRAEILWGLQHSSPVVPARAALRAPGASLDDVASHPNPTSDTSPPASPSSLTIRTVYDRWKVAKPRSQDSEAACLRAVVHFEECLGKTVNLCEINRAQGDQFRAWLLTKNTASKTTRDRFTWIKSLLKYAARDLEALPRSPWEGLDVEARTRSKRRPWRATELQRLFSQPLFTEYRLPQCAKAGRDAAYWIPLLGLFTGARISELAQLHVKDIDVNALRPTLTITDEGEGQRVKSAAGHRTIPLHSELIRLGFLDYVFSRKKAASTFLWPDLKLRDGRPGGHFSAWFGDFRRSVGLTETYPDFHCLRHTVRTTMARAGVASEIQDSITGHERQGSIGAKVYRHIDEAELIRAVDELRYSCLDLHRAYCQPADCMR
jgi:integrase